MTEIWVPYGPVEVSFDIKQENLSQILEPQAQKMSKEDLERQTMECSGADSLLILSQSAGVIEVIDSIFKTNKTITKILSPKHLSALAKRKAQEFLIPSVELFEAKKISSESSEGMSIPLQLKESSNLLVISGTHYDPLFGLSGAASDLLSLNQELKAKAFQASRDELPCPPEKSSASLFASRLLQTCPNVSIVEVVEKSNTGTLSVFTGEPEATHAKALEYWKNSLSVNIPSRYERILFGSGGRENDRTLSDSLARSFFNIARNAALKDSDSKICMIAECSEGLGSEALLKYVTGSFTPGTTLDEIPYFDGLEVLLSLLGLQKDLQVSVVSTLPSYYGGRFDFKTISAARDAPYSLISQGTRAKILVVPDASKTFFTESA